MDAAHQVRLQQLLESGRLTPAPSPTKELELKAHTEDETKAMSHQPTQTAGTRTTRRSKKRAAPKMNLTAVAEETPQFLPVAMNYIVCVSSRSPDILLENDHSLHCLCSFPTRQSAHDWIVQNRLQLARHYLMDPRLSEEELTANCTADGCEDEYYLGEHTSLEILQVPQFKDAEHAPDASMQNLLFTDHFITNHQEEEFEESQQEAEGQGDQIDNAKTGESSGDKEGTRAVKRVSKRRKV